MFISDPLVEQKEASSLNLIPRKVLFGNPQVANPKLSPDGKYLAYSAPDEANVMQLWLRTMNQQDDRVITADRKRGIITYAWTYKPNSLLYIQDSDGDENFHLYLVDVQSAVVRDLTPFQDVKAHLVKLDFRFPDLALVRMNLNNCQTFDVYRINLSTGAIEIDTQNPGHVLQWVADDQLQIRAIVSSTGDGGTNLIFRQNIDCPWEILRHWEPDDDGSIVSFSADGQTLYLLANHNANALRLIALDLETRQKVILAEDAEYDVAETMLHPFQRIVQAVAFQRARNEWQVLDPSIADALKAISLVHSGDFRVLSRDLEDKTWLVGYFADNCPAHYYTYDRVTQTSAFLFSYQPGVEAFYLASMQSIFYAARDGLMIHNYLTLPVGLAARDLPAVMLVHGGPWARDIWCFNSWAQWLANRGYALLQVNYRGSSGYGKAFQNAGDREWGGKMHDDVVDGANWLVQQGIVDRQKIAIMGVSYGGYATLVGLAFTPDVFAVGVDVVGPSNLVTFSQSMPAYWESAKAAWHRSVGNPEIEAEFLESRSPLFKVDQIQKPLLIAHGANDPRVKRSESDQIVAAMRQENKSVKYIVYSDEGHGLRRPENRLHFFAVAEEFLAKHLGGRFEPIDEIQGHSGTIYE
jgi:dipeptidyl aminopeptidase/acylaminoacyl peptidase